jgi:hypothetical protein
VAADRNALRRLQRLLDDETYGPALARLRGDDERRVLQAISENRGADARREILAADQRRRDRIRDQRHQQLLHRATLNTMEQHRAHYIADYNTVRRHLQDGTDAELRFAATATRAQLVERARQAPRTLEAREINPFWYH